MRKLQVGDKIVTIKDARMTDYGDRWLIKNKLYIVMGMDHTGPYIYSEISNRHYIASNGSTYFTLGIKVNKNIKVL